MKGGGKISGPKRRRKKKKKVGLSRILKDRKKEKLGWKEKEEDCLFFFHSSSITVSQKVYLNIAFS